MIHVKYTGTHPDLEGKTALAIQEPFRVQLDDLDSKFSHGWHEADEAEWAAMSNIIIQNKGELPIWGLRLLGLSVKDDDKIGKFGTGLKEAIALANRKGCLPVIFSGTCRITFEVKHDPQEIGFILSEDREQYKANTWYGLGMHTDFGRHDWDDEWMILREVVCNALDEGGLYHDITQEMKGVKGCTRVYIPANIANIKAYTELENRIMALGNHVIIDATPCGSLVAKRNSKGLQVYHRTVWVQESTTPSVYDYELNELKLNESRSADWHDVHRRIAGVIACMQPDELIPLLTAFEQDEEIAEGATLYYLQHLLTASTGAHVCSAFVMKHGAEAVACANDKSAHSHIINAGRVPVIITNSSWLKCLKNAGVPVSEDLVTPSSVAMQSSTSDPEMEALVREVWEKFEQAGLARGKPMPKVRTFTEQPGSSRLLGQYNNGVVYINRGLTASDTSRAIIEELSHYVSEAADFTREFQIYLTESVRILMNLP